MAYDFFNPAWRQAAGFGPSAAETAWQASFAPFPGAFGPSGNPQPPIPPLGPPIINAAQPVAFGPPRSRLFGDDDAGDTEASPGAPTTGPIGQPPGMGFLGMAALDALQGKPPPDPMMTGLSAMMSMVPGINFGTIPTTLASFAGLPGVFGGSLRPSVDDPNFGFYSGQSGVTSNERAAAESRKAAGTESREGLGDDFSGFTGAEDNPSFGSGGVDAGPPGLGEPGAPGDPSAEGGVGGATGGDPDSDSGNEGGGWFKGGRIKAEDVRGADPAGPDEGELDGPVQAGEYMVRKKAAREMGFRVMDEINRNPNVRAVAKRAVQRYMHRQEGPRQRRY